MNIEKLEEYPIFESTSRYLTNKLNGLYNTRKHSGRRYEYEYKCKDLAQRILYSNIGKSFDLAFSYYCSKVPKWCQKFFLEEVEPSWRYQQFFVEDGIITHKKTRYSRGFKRKTPVIYYSDDYKTEWYDIRTGEVLRKNHWYYPGIPNDFIQSRIILGWCKEFESRHDKEFRKLMREKNKRRKKAWKLKRAERILSDIEKTKILLRLHNKRNNGKFKFLRTSFNEHYKDYIEEGWGNGCDFTHYEILKYISDKFEYIIDQYPDFKFKRLYRFNVVSGVSFTSNLPENVSKEFTKNLYDFLYKFHIENPFEKE